MDVIKRAKSLKWQAILICVVYTLLGLVFILFPHLSNEVIGLMIASVGLVYGVYRLIAFFRSPNAGRFYNGGFAIGLLIVAVSLFFLADIAKLIALISVLLGFIVLTDGIVKLQAALDLRTQAVKGWMALFIGAIVNVVLGVLVLVNPFGAADTLLLFVGIFMTLGGAADIVVLLLTGSKIKALLRKPA